VQTDRCFYHHKSPQRPSYGVFAGNCWLGVDLESAICSSVMSVGTLANSGVLR
jgi:hypothetical protein